MYISKKLRVQVYEKFDGHCAYSGTILQDDWQVDHMKPKMICTKEQLTCITNLMPVQKIINHYKRSLLLEDFRVWYLGGLHDRLKKLPKNPRVEQSIRRKEYLLEVAALFDITPEKPFSGKFYFETLGVR